MQHALEIDLKAKRGGFIGATISTATLATDNKNQPWKHISLPLQELSVFKDEMLMFERIHCPKHETYYMIKGLLSHCCTQKSKIVNREDKNHI